MQGGQAVDVLRRKVYDSTTAMAAAGTNTQAVNKAFNAMGDAVTGTGQQVGQFHSDVGQMSDSLKTAATIAADAAASTHTFTDGAAKAGGAFVAFGNSIPVAALNALHEDTSGVIAWGASVSSAALSAKDSMAGADAAIAHLPGTLMGVAKAADLSAAAKSVADFGAKAQTASAETDAFALAVDKLTGRDVPLDDATKALNDSLRALGATYGDATATAKAHADAMVSDKGVIDTTTEAGSKLYDSVSNVSRAYDTQVTAAEDAAGAHATVAQKLKAAQGAADEARASFIHQAEAAGVSHDKAVALANQMGILEGKKLTPKTLHLDAEDKASGTIDSIEKKLQGIKDKTVKLIVDATGGSMKINADGSFTTSAGGHGAAAGTTVTGGIPGVDSVPMLLMPGEEVIKTSEANKHRGLLKDINAGRMANGGTVGGDVHIKASGRGNADPAFASVASYMAHAASSAASLNAAAAKAAAAIPHANSGGTEQWRALFNFVARAKGEPLASVQVGLNQMSRESGGNPAAINLTDINAQQGHPSKGLMQFIDGTFRRFADPGYGSEHLGSAVTVSGLVQLHRCGLWRVRTVRRPRLRPVRGWRNYPGWRSR
jgi:hypothetical protein